MIDQVLAVSDVINSDRLGNTARGLVATRPKYIDFTGADEVGKGHQLWIKARKTRTSEISSTRPFTAIVLRIT